MMRKMFIMLAATAILAASAHAADMAGSNEAGQMSGKEMADAMSQNPDRAFAAVLVSHARLERQLAQLVSQKATDPKIKQLAEQIASDHEKFSERVQHAAQQEGITLNTNRLLPRDQAVLDFMQRLPAESLQRNYVFYEAGAIQTHLLLSQWAANNAQKPAIKQAAEAIVPKLQQRYQTAQQLAQDELHGGAGPSGGQ